MSGEAPAHMADDIIDAIRGREIDGLVTLPRAPRLKPGQKVRVVRGSFEGLVGIYDGMSGIDRERILLDLLGRKVQVTLAGRDVVAALQKTESAARLRGLSLDRWVASA